jgi:hypothetical protein
MLVAHLSVRFLQFCKGNHPRSRIQLEMVNNFLVLPTLLVQVYIRISQITDSDLLFHGARGSVVG